MPKLYKEIIALICVGLLIIFVWVVTATPTNTPIVWVVRATPEPPFTPTITVAPTYTRVPTKTPPTATPAPDTVLEIVQRFELGLQNFPSHINIPWECEHKKARSIYYSVKSFCQGTYLDQNSAIVSVAMLSIDVDHKIRIATMLAEAAPHDTYAIISVCSIDDEGPESCSTDLLSVESMVLLISEFYETWEAR